MLDILDLVRSNNGFQRIVVGGYIDAAHICNIHRSRSTVFVYVFTTTLLQIHKMGDTQWCYENLAYNGYRKINREDIDDEDLVAIDKIRKILKDVNDADVKYDKTIDHQKSEKVKINPEAMDDSKK